MRIRPAVAADIDAITDFNLAMALETEDRALDRARLRAGVEGVFADPRRGFYRIVEVDGEKVGGLLITFEWSDWRNADWWWIQSVYVQPTQRGRGVFSALFDAVESEARSAGACGLRLYVERDNLRAQQTYRRLRMDESHYLMYERAF
ncbi:MAG TPA: GNAT family N-acetyltransferase [Xanthomonadaceae bacterium]|nr:GNAT family N-acetyltransferase [Xanthomonadaceae bacterium]